MLNINMAEYGLSSQYKAFAQEYCKNYNIGRITAQEREVYRLISEKGEQAAAVSGKLRYNAKSASDFPAVGDFVVFEGNNIYEQAVIHDILPRKSVFIRKAAGTAHEEQIVAANIDTVFICMSLNNDFNIRRLERYLSVTWESGATPVIVLTKSDLCSDLKQYMLSVETVACGTDIVVTSGIDKDGYCKLLPHIQFGKTAALIGSSGVGKSTLINRLLKENRLETGGLRNDDKGKHTTTRRELFLLKSGGTVIDTPGMRELGLWGIDTGLDKSFADIEELTGKCKFHNCTHTNEPGCAINEAVLTGEFSEERWLSYRKLKTENEYNENRNGYLAEKKQKFKNIAELNKHSYRR